MLSIILTVKILLSQKANNIHKEMEKITETLIQRINCYSVLELDRLYLQYQSVPTTRVLILVV